MPKKDSIGRRTFLGAGLATAGAVAIGCGRAGSGSPHRFFTAEEGATVDAICEALIPSDRDPGARAAGVVNYIDVQLTRHFKRYQRTYRDGLAAVDRASRAKFGRRFMEIQSEQQASVLAGVAEESKEFFELILAHVRQGFYGDPRHGGNRHMVSWKMVGLPFPQVRGRTHYDEGPRLAGGG
ncbi:MAG TPA: gluconate 2-dehydrogenase subunit 3 family protein [Bryobacteraceae bacterium]|jgi:gluconate 2-dehydrogenase gamma chain|nr:gluconate 2-dehydrogenase subunit 3 family protein [Bryobacteraceae bacterium]